MESKEDPVIRSGVLLAVTLLTWAAADPALYAQSPETADLTFAFPDPAPRKRARELGIVIGHMSS